MLDYFGVSVIFRTGMEYRICNMRMLSFCMGIHMGEPQFIISSKDLRDKERVWNGRKQV